MAIVKVYRGTVKDNAVVLPADTNLPEGAVVEVHVFGPYDEPEQPQPPLNDLERDLLASGLVREITRPPRMLPNVDRTPIQVQGKPLSEIIIEDRR